MVSFPYFSALEGHDKRRSYPLTDLARVPYNKLHTAAVSENEMLTLELRGNFPVLVCVHIYADIQRNS